MDYQFLLGWDFSVGDDVYVIRDVTREHDLAIVHAELAGAAHNDTPSRCRFPVNQVLQWLLVEEEIELFDPSYLDIVRS